MNERNKILMSIVSFMLVILAIGTTQAFFNYTRTGNTNTITVGRISFISRQVDTINLSNLFPIDPTVTGIMDDEEKVGTLEIEIEGDTDYPDGVEYLITVVNATNYTSNGRRIPISLDVTVEDLGDESSTYFTARNSKNANIYKRLSGDEIIGDQMLLVGYIKPNVTAGSASGVDGSITIKAYFDENKIAISDTYDGTESANMGTTNEWVDDRVVLTTTEWNALSTNGISFKVKVEANEGIWVDEPIYNRLRSNAYMDNISSPNVTAQTGIDFSKISGDTDNDNIIDNGEGLYIRSGTENDAYPIVYYRGAVEDNNVYFAGKCWQIIRTTETGGTKLIYNGENTGTIDAPTCEPATGEDRQITLNVSGTDTNRFPFSGNDLYNSLAYNGYMYNTPVHGVTNGDYESGAKFGNGATWNGTSYTITDVSDDLDSYHRYTCGTANATTCSSIRYYFAYFMAIGKKYYVYFTLTNGKTIENVVIESLENGATESNAKVMLEQWYEENINGPNDAKIEDTIYCNDRSIYSLGGLNSNGGTLTRATSTLFLYSGYKRNYIDYNPSTKCLRPHDAFTKESTNGNGLLDYPVGLITIDEISLAGGKFGTANANFYLNTGANYWSLSPYYFECNGYAIEFIVRSNGYLSSTTVNVTFGLRPVVSLKLGTSISEGDGTGASPYIIK